MAYTPHRRQMTNELPPPPPPPPSPPPSASPAMAELQLISSRLEWLRLYLTKHVCAPFPSMPPWPEREN